MKHVILGTAGHIDHGKTALVKALTGVDTDRLKEEKERGITIELGFTFLDLPSGIRLGIIDVPGHERFVKHMVAGVWGIDLVALIIAADEGVMPQTREHLDICKLLEGQEGVDRPYEDRSCRSRPFGSGQGGSDGYCQRYIFERCSHPSRILDRPGKEFRN